MDRVRHVGAVASAFVGRLDDIFGLYLDATTGFDAALARFMKAEQGSRQLLKPGEDPEERRLFYGRGDPNDPSNILYHATTYGEYKRRNARGGRNYLLLSQYLVVLVFHLWEQEYRPELASTIGIDAKELTVPIIGGLRLLRHEILKHRGILSEKTARRLQVLPHLRPGDQIAFSTDDLYTMMRSLKAALDEIVTEYTGVDPKHRIVWHVT